MTLYQINRICLSITKQNTRLSFSD